MALDPISDRQNRAREAARKRAQDQPLDPPFPYRRESFDVFFFGVDEEPKPQAAPDLGSGRL